MNVRRLEKLAAHLESVPRRGFDMGSWVRNQDGFEFGPQAHAKILKAAKNDYKCGMAACLGGHAAVVFPKIITIRKGSMAIVGKRLDDFPAFSHAFDICMEHAERLTDPWARHQTPKAAARAIRKLIKENPPCCSGRLR